MIDPFQQLLDDFESRMHTLDDSKRPHHATLIVPPMDLPEGVAFAGYPTERLRYYVYLRRRFVEEYGPEAEDLPDDEKRRFIEQCKQEFLAERKAAVSERPYEDQSSEESR